MELGKKIRFNNKNWFVKLKQNTSLPFVQVFLYDENSSISNEPYFEDWAEGDTIMDSYKNAVLKANKVFLKCYEYEDLQKWDGNMDKELNVNE
jgi:hypothetical protein